jgi:biofilm PGA synthesis N-glycosyltransferase PgaC
MSSLTAFAMALFWMAGALIVYTYAGYPLLLLLVTRWGRRLGPPEPAGGPLPVLSVLIAVYNEEAVIQAKLNNCDAFDYPAERLEFLFGSDGSDDNTVSLIQAHASPNIRVFNFSGRRGKMAILNDLVLQARGEILVFTDANSLFEPQAASRLARHFQNPRIGGVCGRLVLGRARAQAGRLVADEASYWQFETWVKRLEGSLGLLSAANGAIYAIRRSLFRVVPTRPAVAEDLFLPAVVLAQGWLVTFEPEAVAHETASRDTRAELRRKSRVAEMSYNLIPHLLPMLAPWRGRLAWSLWSHKIIRWMVPFLLLAMLLATLVLWPIGFYRVCLLLQLAGYAAALAGYWLEPRWPLPAWLSLPYYFVGGNAALLIGFIRSLSRSSTGAWARVGR